MPIVLSPYYVHMGIKSGNTWSPYYIAVLTSFIFGTLQGVQDVLDDPFDGISEDDINLGHVSMSLRPNSDLSQPSHCNIKGLSVSVVMRIENMITRVKFY